MKLKSKIALGAYSSYVATCGVIGVEVAERTDAANLYEAKQAVAQAEAELTEASESFNQLGEACIRLVNEARRTHSVKTGMDFSRLDESNVCGERVDQVQAFESAELVDSKTETVIAKEHKVNEVLEQTADGFDGKAFAQGAVFAGVYLPIGLAAAVGYGLLIFAASAEEY